MNDISTAVNAAGLVGRPVLYCYIMVAIVCFLLVDSARADDFLTYPGEERIVSVFFDQACNQIEVVKGIASNSVYTSPGAGMAPDKIWKEVYGVVGGKIQLLKKIEGEHRPPSYVVIPEKYIFREEN